MDEDGGMRNGNDEGVREELLESDRGNEKFPLGYIPLEVLEGHSGETGHEVI